MAVDCWAAGARVAAEAVLAAEAATSVAALAAGLHAASRSFQRSARVLVHPPHRRTKRPKSSLPVQPVQRAAGPAACPATVPSAPSTHRHPQGSASPHSSAASVPPACVNSQLWGGRGAPERGALGPFSRFLQQKQERCEMVTSTLQRPSHAGRRRRPPRRGTTRIISCNRG